MNNVTNSSWRHNQMLQQQIKELNATIEKQNIEYQTMKDKLDSEIDNLNKTIKGLKRQIMEIQTCYIPKKADKVDEVLAEFINEQPETNQLKIMFLRESEGVYRFGQKRVAIKIDSNNQPLIRIGGGFQPVKQFIEEHTQRELDILDRRDAVVRFHKKLQV